MFKSFHIRALNMAEDRFLDKAQARDIEEELFATRRQQASRHMPVPYLGKISGRWLVNYWPGLMLKFKRCW